MKQNFLSMYFDWNTPLHIEYKTKIHLNFLLMVMYLVPFQNLSTRYIFVLFIPGIIQDNEFPIFIDIIFSGIIFFSSWVWQEKSFLSFFFGFCVFFRMFLKGFDFYNVIKKEMLKPCRKRNQMEYSHLFIRSLFHSFEQFHLPNFLLCQSSRIKATATEGRAVGYMNFELHRDFCIMERSFFLILRIL